MIKTQHNLLILNGTIENVEPLTHAQARQWDLKNYAKNALLATIRTDRNVYGGCHQVLITSRHLRQTLAAFLKGRRENRQISCTVIGWLYSRPPAIALPIVGDITFHVPPEELAPEKIEALLREIDVADLALVGTD